jgi:hypothetical protein
MPKDKIMEEIKKTLKELAESQKRTDKEITKLTESQKRTDKEITKLTESQKKTDEEITKLTEKTDKEIADLSKEVDKVSKEVNRVNKMVGDLTDGWGKFVEGLVAPSVPIIFRELGIDIFSLSPRTKRYKDGRELEIDILCLGKDKNGKDLAIITEVKSDVSSKDIDNFLCDIQEFKYFFDEYKGRGIVGVIAGIKFGKGVQKYAERCGLYILGPSDEMMKLLNKEEFEPRVW